MTFVSAIIHRPLSSIIIQRLMLTLLVSILVLLSLNCSAFSFSDRTNRASSLVPLAATSSRHLKEEQNKRGRPYKRRTPPKQNAVQRLARAAANAAALYPQQQEQSPSPTSIGNLRQLTRTIDKQLLLHQQQQNFAPHISLLPQDSMSSLLEYNDDVVVSNASKHVALVFGKTLQDDQVTCEYAARIRALVRLLLLEEQVDVVCFCGGISGKDNRVSNADAGYIFFRHLCASQGIHLGTVNVYIDRTSKDEATAVHHVVKHIQTMYVPDWFQQQQQQASTTSGSKDDSNDEFGGSNQHDGARRTKLSIHYSLISTGYHLCNLNDVHHRSPGQSLLRPIERQGQEEEDAPFLLKTTWSYHYATYPYLYNTPPRDDDDDAVAFLAKCFLLGEELVPLYINLQGVVQEKEFFQRDNYLVLASIRRALVSQMEELYKTKPTLNSDTGRDTNVALEGVVLSLGRCIDLVRPAGLLVGSVSKMDFKKALRALEHAITQIRLYCDPDAPLDPRDWGMLNTKEEESAVTTTTSHHERLYTQLNDSFVPEEEQVQGDEDVVISDEEVVILDDD